MQISELESKRAMRNAIFCQCFGVIGSLCFQNGLLLLYLLSLNISEARTIKYLSLLGLCNGLLMTSTAYFSDRYGKKSMAMIGNVLQVVGYILILLSGFLGTGTVTEICIVAGILVFALGFTLFLASWYPLLKPVVPENMRGRFFAKLRIAWQLLGLCFSAIAAWLLGKNDVSKGIDVSAFQLLWLFVVIMQIIRIFFYVKIPEVEKVTSGKKLQFWKVIGNLLRKPGYVSFSSYIFLLMLFSFSAPMLFAMIEKEVMHLDDKTVVWFANITLIGSLLGFFLAGIAVDRFGNKPVFMFCHFGYAFVIAFFLFRGFTGWMTYPIMGICHFGFGLIMASSSIAFTSETIALLPVENQSIASAVLRTTDLLGRSVSGFVCAMLLDLGFLKDSWVLFGMHLSKYDAILLPCSGMIILLVITLGLVPSVIKPGREKVMEYSP